MACGLSHSKWPNHPRLNYILGFLAQCDLPLNPGIRGKMIAGLKMRYVTGSSRQQLAYMLLTHLPGAEDLPKVEAPAPQLKVVGPNNEALASKASEIAFDRVLPMSCMPWAYGDPDLKQLWQPRREVFGNITGFQCQSTEATLSTHVRLGRPRYKRSEQLVDCRFF